MITRKGGNFDVLQLESRNPPDIAPVVFRFD